MYWYDNKEHKIPHIHVHYQENKQKMIEVWIELHKEELIADWELAINGGELFKIEPLR